MPQPSRITNSQRRAGLNRVLAPVIKDVERARICCAPYALTAQLSPGKQNALLDSAITLGTPPGLIMAREIPVDANGCTIEVLMGWERMQAYLHRDVFPRATKVPLATIEVSDADAAYYAIEHAAMEHKAAGYPVSPIAYALAATQALTHFSHSFSPWSIQTLANALCIARSTLSNRLRLLDGLEPRVIELLGSGALPPEFSKILLAERTASRQILLAERAAAGTLSTRALYQLVHPDYEAPQRAPRRSRQRKQRLGNLGVMERSLQGTYGAPAHIAMETSGKTAGFVELRFHSLSELKGILEKLDTTADTDTLYQGELIFRAANSQLADTLLQEMGASSEPI